MGDSNQTKLSFLLRPPVDEEEIKAAATYIHKVVNTAYDILVEKGNNALLEHIAGQNKTIKNDSSTNNDDQEMMDIGDDESSINNETAKINADPRPYQMAMFERVKTANTIVQLHTGMGKTLISIMTMRHFEKDYAVCNSNGHFKQTWFLVPSVALAVQQSRTLSVNLPHQVATACHTGMNVYLHQVFYYSYYFFSISFITKSITLH